MVELSQQEARKIASAFEKQWEKEYDKIHENCEPNWWKGHKINAGVKDAPWFKKSNNIGPKLRKLGKAAASFDNQKNKRNYKALVSTVVDVLKAFQAFEGNRQIPDTPEGDALKKVVKNDFIKTLNEFQKFLKNSLKTMDALDQLDLASLKGGFR